MLNIGQKFERKVLLISGNVYEYGEEGVSTLLLWCTTGKVVQIQKVVLRCSVAK